MWSLKSAWFFGVNSNWSHTIEATKSRKQLALSNLIWEIWGYRTVWRTQQRSYHRSKSIICIRSGGGFILSNTSAPPTCPRSFGLEPLGICQSRLPHPSVGSRGKSQGIELITLRSASVWEPKGALEKSVNFFPANRKKNNIHPPTCSL